MGAFFESLNDFVIKVRPHQISLHSRIKPRDNHIQLVHINRTPLRCKKISVKISNHTFNIVNGGLRRTVFIMEHIYLVSLQSTCCLGMEKSCIFIPVFENERATPLPIHRFFTS